MESQISIALSGWSGVGCTKTTLLLAQLLNRQYVYIGAVFRELGMRMGYDDEGHDRPDIDAYLEDHIGRVIDLYIEWKLTQGKPIILESDIAAFRIGHHPNVFSIFLKAEPEVRYERVRLDNRKGDVEVLKKRDEILRQKFLELWEIDIFDEVVIPSKYNHVIDSSQMPVEQVVQTCLQLMQQDPRLAQQLDFESAIQNLQSVADRYETDGRSAFRERLDKQGLLMPVDQILDEIITTFPDHVAQFPEDIKKHLK